MHQNLALEIWNETGIFSSMRSAVHDSFMIVKTYLCFRRMQERGSLAWESQKHVQGI